MRKTVLIVDDEVLVRVGLKSLLEGEAEGFLVAGECGSVDGAKSFLRNQPVDYLLTDLYMKPEDGFSLIEWVRKNTANTGIIVLSCHNDFPDMQRAIRSGADDYIFKLSLNKEELLSALQRVGEKRKIRPIGAQDTLPAALREESDPEDHISRFLEHTDSTGSAAVLSFSYEPVTDTALFPLLDTLRNLIQDDGKIPFILEKSLMVLAGLTEKEAEKFVHTLRERSSRYVSAPLHCGYSLTERLTPESLKEAVQQAVRAGKMRFYGSEGCWSYASSIDSKQETMLSDLRNAGFSDTLKELGTAVSLNLFDEIQETASRLFHILYRIAPPDISLTRHYILDMLSPFRVKLHAHDILVSELREENETSLVYSIMNSPTLMDIHKRFDLFLERYKHKQKDVPSRSDIGKAKRFIHEHCCEGISLADTAQHIHMNPSYFSSLFKKETGECYTEYLNRMQVEKAKELLVSGRYLVYEVAELLGFGNASYFSTVFKRVSGKNPQDYIPRKP